MTKATKLKKKSSSHVLTSKSFPAQILNFCLHTNNFQKLKMENMSVIYAYRSSKMIKQRQKTFYIIIKSVPLLLPPRWRHNCTIIEDVQVCKSH